MQLIGEYFASKLGEDLYVAVNGFPSPEGCRESAVSWHGEQDITAASGERNDSLVLPFALVNLARVVVGSEDEGLAALRGLTNIARLICFISSARRVFATDGRTGAARYRREPRVCGQMSGGGECQAATSIGNLAAVLEDEQGPGPRLASQLRHVVVAVIPTLDHARGQFSKAVRQLFRVEQARDAARSDLALWMIHVRPDDALNRRMYLCQPAAATIARLSDLPGQVIIEATQHRELRDLVVCQLINL